MASHPDPTDELYELAPIEPKCPECGYDLRGITNASGARCPECGSRLPFQALQFKEDRAKEQRYRRPKPIRYWLPVFWSWKYTIAVGFVLGATVYFGRAKAGIDYILLAEVTAANAGIIYFRRWQAIRHERGRVRKLMSGER